MILNKFLKLELKYVIILIYLQKKIIKIDFVQNLKEQKTRRDNFSRNTVASSLTATPPIVNGNFCLGKKRFILFTISFI